MSRRALRSLGFVALVFLVSACAGGGGPPAGAGGAPGAATSGGSSSGSGASTGGEFTASGWGAAPRSPDKPPLVGVGTLGTVVEVKPQEKGLVVEQFGFDYAAPPGMKRGEDSQEFAVGSRKNRLQVHVKDDTKVYLEDAEKTLSDLKAGDQLLVVGTVTGGSLHADVITDLRRLDPPADSQVAGTIPRGAGSSAPGVLRALADSPTSMCMGQDLSYGSEVAEFQGCWGGPSASDDIDLPFIPLFCPLIGCFGLDRFSYTMALGGWGFAFPFAFGATATPGLVYHQPGNVTFGIQPLPATTGSFSFSGGLGIDIGLNIDFCTIFGCYNVWTFHLSKFSMIHQATGAGPLEGELEIAEVSCPAIALIPLEGIPIDALSLGLCEDLGLNGRPFHADVSTAGASPGLSMRHGFTSAGLTASVRPDAMQVGVRYDDLAWSPAMTMGLAFRFIIFGAPVYTTPSIPFGEMGPWDAIPLGSGFTVATDPLSPAGDLSYLWQPTFAAAALDVAPAPTSLTITSATLLAEGTPVAVRLTESYDGSPIVGQPVTLVATGLNGTPGVSATATTGATGAATWLLPPGEYDVTARYAGALTYLPSTARQPLVMVYRPTTFVIWGGNRGGVQAAQRVQFWGQGWVGQVLEGPWGGNPSFQGYSVQTGPATWESPPASSGRGPASVPDVIGVIVTTEAQGRGSLTTGNVASHAVLRVESPASYRPDAGHGAWGVVRTTMP